MNIIVCVDDNNGMMFNKRRVSQDVEVREDIYKNLNGKTLFIKSNPNLGKSGSIFLNSKS